MTLCVSFGIVPQPVDLWAIAVRRSPCPARFGGIPSAMTKSELIAKLAALNPHLYQRDVERIVATIFDEIAIALARGDRVELRGFRSEERRVGKECA